jgi:hypothetical protein
MTDCRDPKAGGQASAVPLMDVAANKTPLRDHRLKDSLD